MEKDKFSFELEDKFTPKEVVEKALGQISEATRGYVIGKIEDYEGPIRSYTKTGVLKAAIKSMNSSKEVNIQEKLGKQDEEKNRYEVYLTAKKLANYRYRMMFVDYGTVSYPATIVMSEDLAFAYSGKRNDTFCVNSMKELEEMLNIVINSDEIVFIIQSLINESLRCESGTQMKRKK